MGGSLAPVRVAGFTWNGWQPSAVYAPGAVVSRPELKKQIREVLGQGNAQADSESDWLICFYHDPSASKEPIVLNFDKCDGPVLDLLDDDKRQAVIGNLVDHQVKLVKDALLFVEGGKIQATQ